MFSSHPLLITGGNFTQINDVRPIHPSQASLDRLLMSVSPAAFHNSGERRDSPKCHPNTRVAILKKLKEWILGLDPMRRGALIKWLHGPAGSGKSAIAQTLADWSLEEGILLASYFFSRFDSTRNHSRSLIATIAYQVGCHFVGVNEVILAAINADPLIFTRSLMTQIRSLVVEPLHSLITSGHFRDPKSKHLIIIDGLDECNDRDGPIDIIRTISKALQDHHLPLIFLIASRPEHDITLSFGSKYLTEVTSRFPLDDTYQLSLDIKLFLESEFDEIKDNHPFKAQLPPEWPGLQTLEELVMKSSGQFIYAATVTKFVKSTRHKPALRLETVLGLRTPVGDRDLPFSELDALYHHVFAGVEDIGLVLKILSFHLLTKYRFIPDVRYMERILSLNPGDIDTLFCDLHAVIDFRPLRNQARLGSELHLLHASLEDFLLDRSRSKALYIDPPNRHAEFAHAIFKFFPDHVSDRDIYVYAHHFERASPSHKLRHEILNLDTTGIFRFVKSDRYRFVYSSLEYLWNSIKCSQFSDASELCLHHTHAMDKYAADRFEPFYSDKPLTAFLAASYIVNTQVPDYYPAQWFIVYNDLFQLQGRLASNNLFRYELTEDQRINGDHFKMILQHHFKDETKLEACHADGAIYMFQCIQRHIVPSYMKHGQIMRKCNPWKWKRMKIWKTLVFRKNMKVIITRRKSTEQDFRLRKIQRLHESLWGDPLLMVESLEFLHRILRKAGRSKRLIDLARRFKFGILSAAFPKETACAKEAIAEYLKRVDTYARYR